jgi:hypothetical protein
MMGALAGFDIVSDRFGFFDLFCPNPIGLKIAIARAIAVE